LSYYTTKRLLNHRTNDVTQGYIQFDLEQLRGAMQAVEDFVLKNVETCAQPAQPSDSAYAPTHQHQINEKRPFTVSV
jgi:hypothetical protein